MSIYLRTGKARDPAPQHQAAAVLTQAAAVANTWYTVLSVSGNLRVYTVAQMMSTAAEDLEIRLTIDGVAYAGAKAGAVAGSWYFYQISGSLALNMQAQDYREALCEGFVDCRVLLVEVRKTSAAGANTLNGIVHWARW